MTITYKDKFKIVQYIQQFKDKEQEGKVNKMLDEAILGTIYKYGTRGFIVKLIQKCLNVFLKDYNAREDIPIGFPYLIEDGLFGGMTKRAVEHFQEDKDLVVDGIVGRNTLKSLINNFLLG